MPPEPTPNLWDHNRRLKDLEARLAVVATRIDDHLAEHEDRASSVDGSLRPGGARVHLKNLPPWVYVIVFATFCGTVVGVVWGLRPVERHEVTLPGPTLVLPPASK